MARHQEAAKNCALCRTKAYSVRAFLWDTNAFPQHQSVCRKMTISVLLTKGGWIIRKPPLSAALDVYLCTNTRSKCLLVVVNVTPQTFNSLENWKRALFVKSLSNAYKNECVQVLGPILVSFATRVGLLFIHLSSQFYWIPPQCSFLHGCTPWGSADSNMGCPAVSKTCRDIEKLCWVVASSCDHREIRSVILFPSQEVGELHNKSDESSCFRNKDLKWAFLCRKRPIHSKVINFDRQLTFSVAGCVCTSAVCNGAEHQVGRQLLDVWDFGLQSKVGS